MIDLKVNNYTGNAINSEDLHKFKKQSDDGSDYISSIFSSQKGRSNALADKNTEILNEQLENIKNKNGTFLSLWNDVKKETGLGITDKKCKEVIESYKKGEMTFEEADERLKEYSVKQDDSLNLHSNIAASVAALAATAVAAGCFGIAAPLSLIMIGAGIGGATKAGFKFYDRATNKVVDDEFNTKQIVQDGLSGAVAGAIATATMGTASSAPNFVSAVKGCGITGVKAGSVSCGANYAIDSAFDENKDFKASEFIQTTAEGAVVGGIVGAFMGGFNSTMHSTGILKSGCSFNAFVKTAKDSGTASSSDAVANSVCTSEYKVVTDRLKSVYS